MTIPQQIQSYIDAGMDITSYSDVEEALRSIGYYRLRGYSFHLYDNSAKKYIPGTKFDDILKLYYFDQNLSNMIFSMISKIEVTLRVRLVEALLIHGDSLILQYSSIFKDKTTPPPTHNDLYQILLAMKYLSPSTETWNTFINKLEVLVQNNNSVIELTSMNFPTDWKNHLVFKI